MSIPKLGTLSVSIEVSDIQQNLGTLSVSIQVNDIQQNLGL